MSCWSNHYSLYRLHLHVVDGFLSPSSLLQLSYRRAIKGATKGIISQSPSLVSQQVFKYSVRCEGGSSEVPARVQSKLSPAASPVWSGSAPPAVTGCVEGNQTTVCPSPLSSPEYFPLHNAAQSQWVGICSLCIFFNSAFTTWSLDILQQSICVGS